MRTWSGLISFFALLATLSLAGCKQGDGENCQIDSDCEDGLECVQEGESRMVCRSTDIEDPVDAAPTPDAEPGTPDATPAIDAPGVDAAGVDAPTAAE
jgi:hypothetical protein